MFPPDVVATSPPIPDSYWVVPSLLLAGAYPGSPDDRRAEARVARFVDAGIRTFLNLTEDTEPLVPYAPIVDMLAAEAGVACKCIRYPIKDHGVPTRTLAQEILAAIRSEIDAGRPVYVHCWGGVGRTGTIIGCWLVEQGVACDEAIGRIATLRRGVPGAWMQSPEMDEQRAFVSAWRAPQRAVD
jgi:rhodanese/phosphatase family protein